MDARILRSLALGLALVLSSPTLALAGDAAPRDDRDDRERERDRDKSWDIGDDEDWDFGSDHHGRWHDPDGTGNCSHPSHHGDEFGYELDFDFFGWDSDLEQTRVQVLDFPIFSLVDVRSREPNHRHIEVLHAPLVTGFESHRTETGRRIKVLDLPLVSLFELEREGEEIDIGFMNLPLVGSLYSQRTDRKGRERVNVLFLFRFVGPAKPRVEEEDPWPKSVPPRPEEAR